MNEWDKISQVEKSKDNCLKLGSYELRKYERKKKREILLDKKMKFFMRDSANRLEFFGLFV